MITFNKRAAEELTERLDAALAPLGVAAGAVRVRTFHALGREILRDAGRRGRPADRPRRRSCGRCCPGRRRRERGSPRPAFSRLKLDLGVDGRRGRRATRSRARSPGRSSRTSARSRRSGGARLRRPRPVRAVACLDGRSGAPRPLARRVPRRSSSTRSRTSTGCSSGSRSCSRPRRTDIFLVGDDDQSIYGWRLADVRRILGLEALLPGLRRVDLEVNYRCPRPVVERAVRLVEHNDERFAKTIRAGPVATGRLILARTPPTRRSGSNGPSDPGPTTARRGRSWPAPTGSSCPRSSSPSGSGCRSGRRGSSCSLDSPDRRPAPGTRCDAGRSRRRCSSPSDASATRRWTRCGATGTRRRRARSDRGRDRPARLGGRPRPTWPACVAAIAETRARLAELRRDDAALTLATAHATKGLEFDHVIVVGMETGRFPSARAVGQAEDPVRAYEEERRLGVRRVDPRATVADARCTTRRSPPRSCSRRSTRTSSALSPAIG